MVAMMTMLMMMVNKKTRKQQTQNSPSRASESAFSLCVRERRITALDAHYWLYASTHSQAHTQCLLRDAI